MSRALWSKHFDPSTRLYYYHDPATHQTVWELAPGESVRPFIILNHRESVCPNEIPVPFYVPPPPWKGFLDPGADTELVEDDMESEIKQIAMEAFLRESGLSEFSSQLVSMGYKSVEELSDPLSLTDSDLTAIGFSLAQIRSLRRDAVSISPHLPQEKRKSIVDASLAAHNMQAIAVDEVSTEPASLEAKGEKEGDDSGWENVGVDNKEVTPSTPVLQPKRQSFATPTAAPPPVPVSMPATVPAPLPIAPIAPIPEPPISPTVSVPSSPSPPPPAVEAAAKRPTKEEEYFKAQVEAKKLEEEKELSKLTPEQREKKLEEEQKAKQHDSLKTKHVLKTTGMFRASGGNPLKGGRGGGAGRGGRGGSGAKTATAGTSYNKHVPAAPPVVIQPSPAPVVDEMPSPPPPPTVVEEMPSPPPPPTVVEEMPSPPPPPTVVEEMPSPPPLPPPPVAPVVEEIPVAPAVPPQVPQSPESLRESTQTSSRESEYFRNQAEAKKQELEAKLAKMTPEQREAHLLEQQKAQMHDDLKTRHVLKTTGMFRASGGNPLKGGRGGGAGRGGRGK